MNTDDDSKRWRYSLQPGDKIALRTGLSIRLLGVERVTKTLIISTDGRRFRKDTGRAVGKSSYRHSTWLCKPTDKLVEEHERACQLLDVRQAVDRQGDELSADQIKRIRDILSETLSF